MRTFRIALSPLLGVALGLTALGGLPAAASQRTLYVDDDGHAGRIGCDGTKPVARRVQRAIRFARPGDTIMVCPGTYTEQLTITGDREGLTVRAVDPWTAIIRTPRDLKGPSPSLITIDSVDRVRLRSLRLEAHTVEPCDRLSHAVRVRHSRETELRSLRIAPRGLATLGPCGYNTGIVVHRGASASLRHNRVQDFALTGIWVYGGGTSADVFHNSIRYFHATETIDGEYATGIQVDYRPRVDIRDNVIRSGPGPGWTTPLLLDGMGLTLGDGSVVAGNRVQRTFYGIVTDVDGPPPRAVIRDNLITEGSPDGVGLWIQERATYIRNRVSGYAVGAYADTGHDGAPVATLRDNDFRGNDILDCNDANGEALSIWIDNLGDTSDPPGLCSPGP